jgi:predicted transcriptional regulator of viral defense system
MPARDKSALSELARASRTGLISVGAAAAALGVPPAVASSRLARLVRSGWAVRVRRGLYLIPPLESRPGYKTTADDPWVLARELFSPCYIGGWSAAEHWGLTEQLFRSTLVVTAASVRRGHARILDAEFRLFAVRPAKPADGIVQVWRGAEQVPISGAERTLVDCLDAPELCGGVRHLAQMLGEYGDSRKRDLPRLLAIADAIASGAAWKRLGYLAEVLWPDDTVVVSAARPRLSAGYARLDPAVRQRGRLLKRWRLWVNVDLTEFGLRAS